MRYRYAAALAIPASGIALEAALIAAAAAILAASGVGVSAAGWVVGAACALAMNAALARGLSRHAAAGLTPADRVTLARATLAVVIAALVADSFNDHVPRALLLALTIIALALDAVDGWVARRTSTAGTLGARFDGEVDAFLILVLSVYVAQSAGVWVLAIGLARYVFLAAGWVRPWMRAPLPERFWRKVVAAVAGIVLAVAAADVLPRPVTGVALLVTLGLLAESFGRDVLWLSDQREKPAHLAVAPTVLAGLLVWFALVAPDEPNHLHLGALIRVPLEGLVLLAAAVLLPTRHRRVLTAVAGPLLGLLLLLKLLSVGFYGAFDRPFDPYQDVGYTGRGIETLRLTFGPVKAYLITGVLIAFILGVLVVATLALRRVVRVAAAHRDGSLRAVTALGAVWMVCWLFGASFVTGAPVASTSAAGLVVHDVSAAWTDIRDRSVFAAEIRRDPFARTSADRLLAGLRGKDVLLVFVESYGKVAVQDSSFSASVDAALANGTEQLRAAGFTARSGFLTSPTFGGISWLAHSTLQSGVWTNSPRRYSQLLASHRFTLSSAFARAGWRTVDDVPADDSTWVQAKSFYHFDQLYDRRNVGYHGPTYAYASMPDQYTFAALQRLELGQRSRPPLFAEVDTVSSHEPWTRIPRMIPWTQVGDGSIFNRLPVAHTSEDGLGANAAWAWLTGSHADRIQAAYGQSIVYSLNTLVSFVKRYAKPNLVLVVLGDHEPWEIVSGRQPSHDVPISIIAHDPKVLDRIAGWGWNPGLRPNPGAPVWPMSAFRNRFLGAFEARPAGR